MVKVPILLFIYYTELYSESFILKKMIIHCFKIQQFHINKCIHHPTSEVLLIVYYIIWLNINLIFKLRDVLILLKLILMQIILIYKV